MWVEVHIHSVKAKSQAGNTKRPKPKENQLGILKIYAFCWKIQQRASGPVESTIGVTYLNIWDENTPKKLPHHPPKSYCNFTKWFKEGHSWSIVVT